MRSFVAENFEKDYWGTSGYDAYCKILEIDDRNQLTIWALNTNGQEFLLPEQADRVIVTSNVMEADYVIELYSAEPESSTFYKYQLFDEAYSE